jgi:hypothetical protein
MDIVVPMAVPGLKDGNVVGLFNIPDLGSVMWVVRISKSPAFAYTISIQVSACVKTPSHRIVSL